jgi:hypothetical protein
MAATPTLVAKRTPPFFRMQGVALSWMVDPLHT